MLYVDIRPSVCRLSETFVHPTQTIEMHCIISLNLVSITASICGGINATVYCIL